MTLPGKPAGVVGWNPPAVEKGRRVGAAQPRWFGRVDLERAVACSAWAVSLYEQALALPEAPLFAGGTYDAWPAKVVDALAVCRHEHAAVRAYEAAERLEVARG